MYLYRDSQRRIYLKDTVYFLTSATYNRYPFFNEEVFCNLFIENLRLCKKIKGFKLYGWVLCEDHFHLLIMPGDVFNYSKVMQFLKRHVSIDTQIVMGDKNEQYNNNEGAIRESRLRDNDELIIFNRYKYILFILKFRFKIKHLNKLPFPIFRWQKSYHDHIIRDESDFDNHIQYIKYNPIKHNLSDNWKYVFTNPKYLDLIDCLE